MRKSAFGVSFAIRRAEATGKAIFMLYVAAGGAPTESFLSEQTMCAIGKDGKPLYPHLAAIATNRHRLDQNKDFPCKWVAREYPRRRGNREEAYWWPVSKMYDHGIKPIKDCGIKVDGILWYQGESNATTCVAPDTALPSDYIEEIGIIPQARNTDRYCWNKLFRMSVIMEHDIYFDESISYREDILFVYQYLAYCTRKVQSVSYDMYVYFMRDSGAAISLQRSYTRKSGGRFFAMTKCYDILDQIGVNEATMHRMRDEVLNAYKKVIELIDKAEVGRQEKRVYSKKLRNYCNGWVICLMEMKSVYHRIKRFFI